MHAHRSDAALRRASHQRRASQVTECPWTVRPGDIIEQNQHYTATFDCTNGETGAMLKVAITQKRGGTALDLVGALRAAAEVLRQVSEEDDDDTSLN